MNGKIKLSRQPLGGVIRKLSNPCSKEAQTSTLEMMTMGIHSTELRERATSRQ
jgi:hypothetical protein